MADALDNIPKEYMERAWNVMKRTGGRETLEEKLSTAFFHIKNAGPYCSNCNGRKILREFYKEYKETIDRNQEMVTFFNTFFPAGKEGE
jgi:hypothetical protein